MKLRDANLQVHEKKSFSYPPSCNIFCLHSLRTHHDYFFQRGFESVWAKFFSRNISKKYIIVTCDLPVLLRFIKSTSFIVECGIWLCLEYGFCQVNSNSLQYKDYNHTLFFLPVLDM